MSKTITKSELQIENEELQEMCFRCCTEKSTQEIKLNLVSLISNVQIKTEEQAKLLRRVFLITSGILGSQVLGTQIIGISEKGGVTS